ncbi:hypothetical protein [Oceanobacillus salinisoli]|uniref:hypothetical protein n=1 Tax=Oceanobacillus salinisoli TaxID=2678611 RepID=UPI0012E1D296|nr:hypothetical protein [Oceanobacillus salinisoli]
MKLDLDEGKSFKEVFLLTNKKKYKKMLGSKVQEFINVVENEEFEYDYLYDLSYKLIEFIHKSDAKGITQLADKQGELWAKSGIDVTLKIDWFDAFTEVYWEFLSFYYEKQEFDVQRFFQLQKETTRFFNVYLRQFIKSYDVYQQKS